MEERVERERAEDIGVMGGVMRFGAKDIGDGLERRRQFARWRR